MPRDPQMGDMRLLRSFQDASRKARDSELGRNTLWMLGGQLARTVIQSVYFVVLARSLRPDGYGAFVGALAVVMVAAPFVSLGSGFIMIKHVARRPEAFPRYWGNALFLVATSGTALLAACLAAAWLVLPSSIPLALVLLLGSAELLLARVIELAAQAFVGFRLLKWTSAIHFQLSALRLVAIVILYVAVPSPSPVAWGIGYLVSTSIAAVAALVLVRTQLGAPRLRVHRDAFELGEGFYFAIGLSAQSFYNDIDKSLLSRISGLSASGIYGAAYRIIDVSFAPVSALIAAAYARFFQHGERGLRSALSVSRRLMPSACAYAALCSVALITFAPLLPLVLGDGYRDTVDALRWLAPIPLLRAAHYFLADALSGAGHQRARSVVQVLVALVNIGLNVWLLPRYSWRGAAWASIASDGLLLLGFVYVVVRYLGARRDSATTSV